MTLTLVFSFEFCKILKNIVFTENLQATASVFLFGAGNRKQFALHQKILLQCKSKSIFCINGSSLRLLLTATNVRFTVLKSIAINMTYSISIEQKYLLKCELIYVLPFSSRLSSIFSNFFSYLGF